LQFHLRYKKISLSIKAALPEEDAAEEAEAEASVEDGSAE
jgi:hypothetical protein